MIQKKSPKIITKHNEPKNPQKQLQMQIQKIYKNNTEKFKKIYKKIKSKAHSVL